MNKKLIKALSIFVIAGAISTGAAFGLTACKSDNDDPGKQEQTDAVTEVTAKADKTTATVGETVTLTATVKGTGTFSQEVTWAVTSGNGTLDGNKLTVTAAGKVKVQATSKTDTTKKSSELEITFTAAAAQFEIPAAADDLIVEGYGEATVQLSETVTSHAIDKTKIKVYLNDGEGKTKKTEVPAENVVLGIKDPDNHDCEWSGLKANGAYKISVSLEGVKVAAGSQLQASDFASMITVTVKNGIKADSLAIKTGATVTQAQGATDKMTPTWSFEVTRENGDKEDVPASEVKITNVDTMTVATEATANVAWKEMTTTVKYSITADATKVNQSYVLSFGSLTAEQVEAVPTSTVANPIKVNDVFTFVAGKGAIAKENTAGENLFFNTRLKFGGKSAAKELEKQRFIKVTAADAGKLTIYAYSNTGTAPADGAAPAVCADRLVGVYKNAQFGDGSSTAAYSVPVSDPQTTYQKYISIHTFDLPEAGDYYIIAEGGDVCFAYVRLDMVRTAGAGITEVAAPAGTNELVKLSVSTTTANYKQVFKKGDTFSVNSEYKIKGLTANNVTGAVISNEEVTQGVTYWKGETELVPGTTAMDTLGDNVITVKVGNLKAEYTVTVESAVEGVTGATVAVKSSVNPEVTGADGKLTLNYTDIEAKIVGTNTTATASVTSLKYRLASAAAGTETAIAANGSAQLGIGAYVIVAEVTVTAGTGTATFTAETTLSVTKKVEGALVTLATYNVGIASSAITNDTPAKVTVTNNGTTLDGSNYKFDDDTDSLDIAVSGLKAGQQLVVTVNCKSGSSTKQITFTLTATGSATAEFTSAVLGSDYADVAVDAINVTADGTVTISIVRGGGGTLRLASVKIEVKGEAA